MISCNMKLTAILNMNYDKLMLKELDSVRSSAMILCQFSDRYPKRNNMDCD